MVRPKRDMRITLITTADDRLSRAASVLARRNRGWAVTCEMDDLMGPGIAGTEWFDDSTDRQVAETGIDPNLVMELLDERGIPDYRCWYGI
jgi:hypothetical protein